MAAEGETDGWIWACVEIFGHRRHVGRTREEEHFGAKMLRIDIPRKGDPETHGWETHYYSGGALFSFSLTDEASAIKANKPYEPAGRISFYDSDGESGGDDEREVTPPETVEERAIESGGDVVG